MSQPSQQLADRYGLRLSAQWCEWFDQELHRVRPPGAFQQALTVDQLLADCPAEIWPGFMLPDTLPVVGNQYGDWLCVRVQADGHLGEVLHWYHGGGDWIPVGRNLAEAFVHDAVDSFRALGRQTLRGASETVVPKQRERVLTSFDDVAFRDWAAPCLSSAEMSLAIVGEVLRQLSLCLHSGNYQGALDQLHAANWSADAVACDQIELALQSDTHPLADPKLARSLGINWSPDYLRSLFDVRNFSAVHREAIERFQEIEPICWPQQDWELAASRARTVLERRQDLGWAFDILGWAHQRGGDMASAATIYFAGRHASAYSSQAVRLRTHWAEPPFGKFSLTQLAALSEHLDEQQLQDDYLQAIWNADDGGMLMAVQAFWLERAHKAHGEAEFEQAYEASYRSGWDMGAPRLKDYQDILRQLVASAEAAGQHARAIVAQTHLDCLLGRAHG